MRGFGWDYPPGTPGPRETEVEVKCVNPTCEQYAQVEGLPATNELGGCWLHNEDDVFCSSCGWERSDDATPYHVVQTCHSAYVLVSERDDEVLLTGPPSELQQARKGYVEAYFARQRTARAGA